MSDYEPGTIARITTEGIPDRLAIKVDGGDWITVYAEASGVSDFGRREVTDIRRLVVLDLDAAGFSPHELVDFLRRDAMPGSPRDLVAGQIAAQIKPTEPTGLGAVVEDADGKRWIRVGGPILPRPWATEGNVGGNMAGWLSYEDINAVRILSEGVSA